MKRFISIFAAAALLCQAAIVFAQDSGEPSTQTVLDAARAKYWQDKATDPPSDSTDATQPSEGDQFERVSYTPILISLVPGVSLPFGYYDASLVGGAIGNISRDVSGAEGAGVFNLSRDVKGFQGAGVFNIARDMLGFQSAGMFNLVDGNMTGFQGSGVFNIVGGRVLSPFQGAGVFNIAGRVAGGQFAGVFNKADRVAGVQVGLVNVAEHIDGVQLGLVNIAGNGVNSLGATYEPSTNFVFAHWQAGTPALYTLFGIGSPADRWFRDYSGFVASFGLGSRTRVWGLNIDLDVSAEQAVGALPFGSFDRAMDCGAWEGWSQIRPYPSVRLTAGLPLGRHLQIVGGIDADLDLDSLGQRVPQALKGDSWRGSLFGEGFTAYYKWFFGVKI
jgi:hypothetical protein